jgi:O-antigen/teichoic acid export membrane protein
VTVLDLGEKTFFAPQMLITSSLILVAGTRWSNADVADPRTAAGYRSALRRTVAGATIAAIATAAALLVIANVAHSSLAAAHLGHAIPIAICLLVGLPFESVSILSARLMTSTQHTQVLPLFAVVAFVTNLIGDLIGASMFGIVGIAVATVCVRIATAALFVPHCRRLTSTPRSAPVGSLIAVARLEDANASV